jgi:WD40 repeat protein
MPRLVDSHSAVTAIRTRRLVALAVLVIAMPLLSLFMMSTAAGRSSFGVGQTLPAASVQGWVKPQAGWIYVLDSNYLQDTSQILLLNPVQRIVVEAVQSGYAPDMALSPDGKHLYVASGAPGVISVVDTNTGGTIQRFPANDRIVQVLAPGVQIMTVSPTGRWVGVVERSDVDVTYSIAIFDALNNYALISQTSMGSCGIARLVWVSDSKAFVHCPLLNSISVLILNQIGIASATPLLQVPETPHPQGAVGIGLPIHVGRAAHIAFLPDGESAAIFSPFGEVFDADFLSQKVSPKIGIRTDSFVFSRDWPHSSDGRKIYIGVGTPLRGTRNGGTGETSEIDTFDTESWQYTGAIKTSVPFWSIAISKDDRYLYAVGRSTKKVLVIDTATNTELSAIGSVGVSPALAIVAP